MTDKNSGLFIQISCILQMNLIKLRLSFLRRSYVTKRFPDRFITVWYFFGAGNLIFPPTLGALSGNQFWPAIAGFVLSGVGIAIVTLIIGTLNPKGYIDEISRKISPVFAIVYLVALYLSIGPFFAIPRTATVSFEVGTAPLLGGMNASLALFILPWSTFACLSDCFESI